MVQPSAVNVSHSYRIIGLTVVTAALLFVLGIFVLGLAFGLALHPVPTLAPYEYEQPTYPEAEDPWFEPDEELPPLENEPDFSEPLNPIPYQEYLDRHKLFSA